MIPISDKDMSRIFGAKYFQNLRESGFDEFYLEKIEQGASNFWYIKGKKYGKITIVRKIRSEVILGKILGVQDKFSKEYDEWEKIVGKNI